MSTMAEKFDAARAAEEARDSTIPAHAQRLMDDAKAAGHAVEWSREKINGKRYLTVRILVRDSQGAKAGYSALWRDRGQGWRFWYADDQGHSITLRELRTWVTDRHHQNPAEWECAPFGPFA